MLPIDVKEIGRVRKLSEEVSVLDVEPAYADALDGVAEGGSVQVLFWMHELKPKDRDVLRVHPRGDRARPRKGVFALRSPMRPNPIGVTVVRVREVRGTSVFVSGLDAMDGSPIIDIKGGGGRK